MCSLTDITNTLALSFTGNGLEAYEQRQILSGVCLLSFLFFVLFLLRYFTFFKMRYFIYFSYNGTNYHGWQIQPNAVSVQETMEKAMSLVLREPVQLTGAGRTDTGVHAKSMVAHFDVPKPICGVANVVSRLNSLLPYDIAVSDLREVAADAHSRFDAKSRTYKYYVTTCKNPFSKECAAYISYPLDFELMNEAAKILLEFTDFTSFSKLHTDVKTNDCDVMQAEWSREGDYWVFTIKANRFLRNMVRAIVGTLIEVGRGKVSVERFREIIECKDRCKAGTSAPAQGLFLVDVEY